LPAALSFGAIATMSDAQIFRVIEPSSGPRFDNKSIYDDLYELSSERRNGYSWFGSEPQIALDRFEKWSQQHPESK